MKGKRQGHGACAVPDKTIGFDDSIQGRQEQNLEKDVGDFVLLRADGLFAYQLAVVVDDDEQGINHIVRGADLLASTPRQIWLYECMGRPVPVYAHLPLVVNENGEKLSKQTRAAPVDFADPVTMLGAAMRFLNLAPEKDDFALQDLWNWAIMNWSINIAPKTQTIKTPI